MQPSRWARWPITHSSPTVVGQKGVVWMMAPSWIDVRAPTVISPSETVMTELPEAVAIGRIIARQTTDESAVQGLFS